MSLAQAFVRPLPLLLLSLAACDNPGPSFALGADSASLTTLADQGADLATNTMVFPLATGEPLVLWYGQPTPAAAHAMAMGYLQRAIRRGAAAGPGSAATARVIFRSLPPTSGCVPVITGIGADSLPIDSDHDGVPDDWKIDYGSGCVDADSTGTHTITYQGSVEFKDTGAGLKSARAIVSGFRATDVGNADWGTLINWANGVETLVYTPGKATDDLQLVAGQIIPGWNHYFTEDFTASLVPDSGSAFALGALTPSGRFDLQGEFRFVTIHIESAFGDIPPNYRVVLSTPSTLHLDFNCSGLANSGTLLGRLNGNPLVGFQLTYSGCGSDPEKEIFGATP